MNIILLFTFGNSADMQIAGANVKSWNNNYAYAEI